MRGVRSLGGLAAAVLIAATLTVAQPAWANHPVLVEGNCFGPGSGATATGLRNSPVEPGTCGDHDGDGLIGAAEDGDLDNNYGTITAALTAVAQNGTVTVVEDGTFPEAVRLTPIEGGSVTLEAAPGVRANLDAVVQGQAGNAERAVEAGVAIKGCEECRVTIRNLGIRNFARGVNVRGRSSVLMQELRADGNLHHGIIARGRARVTISGSSVNATGYRKDAAGVAEASPGVGIRIRDVARALITHTQVANSRSAGIKARRSHVELRHVDAFGNSPNLALR